MKRNKLNLFVPITKVDEEKRLVYGTITEEVVDKSGEILDYEQSKPYFKTWSEDAMNRAEKAGLGETKGNLRVMHTSKVAGKLTEINFDDDNRRIEACAKVVDDDEWKKVLEGCYTGFSMGGKYVSRSPDKANKNHTRFVASPAEVSLVDNPCVPTATFSVVKADGMTMQKNFIIWEPDNGDVAKRAIEIAKSAGSETRWPSFIEQAREALIAEKAQGVDEDDAAGADEEDDAPNSADASNEDGEKDTQDKAKKADSPEDTKDGEKKPAKPTEDSDDAGTPADQQNKKDAEAQNTEKSARIEDLGLVQVWQTPDGKTFSKKAEAVDYAMKESDPVAKALAKAQAALKADGKAKDDKKPYGDVKYADPKNGKYPIDTEEHIRAAWSYINQEKNQKDYTTAEVDDIKSKIIAAWKKEIDKAGPPSAEKMALFDGPDGLKKALQVLSAIGDDRCEKGMYTVQSASRALSCIADIAGSVAWEERMENDKDSKLPQMVVDLLASMKTFVVEMIDEEVAEQMVSIQNTLSNGVGVDTEVMNIVIPSPIAEVCEMSAKVVDLTKNDQALFQKIGARNSKNDAARIQEMHDHAAALGAKCTTDDTTKSDEGEFTKAYVAKLEDQVAKAVAGIETLTAEIEKIKAEPLPPAPRFSSSEVVRKSDDKVGGSGEGDEDTLEKMLKKYTPDQMADMMFRLSHRSGGTALTDRGQLK